ncbi:hypothetical protein CFBP3846_P400081 (plasmid) [Pseudomonas syringae pv. avii]|uniref:Uncharacterized protein n=1 Tax=Pseudomonas syringae pv. avii TaxID=663959 RepID=A0ABY1UG16_PSESX|nr:hypothetical protein CFBP3846_P400081 [Pseudomonas syringae pv. avii]
MPETIKGALGTLFVLDPETTQLSPRFALREHSKGLPLLLKTSKRHHKNILIILKGYPFSTLLHSSVQ